MVHKGNIALAGDAAHARNGNFGAGAGFAFEDAYTLAESLVWAHSSNRPIAAALDLYDSIRSPHYRRLYAVIDKFSAIKNAVSAEDLSIDEEIEARIRRVALTSETWMYYYDIEQVVGDAIDEANRTVN